MDRGEASTGDRSSTLYRIAAIGAALFLAMTVC